MTRDVSPRCYQSAIGLLGQVGCSLGLRSTKGVVKTGTSEFRSPGKNTSCVSLQSVAINNGTDSVNNGQRSNYVTCKNCSAEVLALVG